MFLIFEGGLGGKTKKHQRGWSRKGEFIRLCSHVSGNSLGYESQAFVSWELIAGWGWEGVSDTNNGVDPSLAPPFRQNLFLCSPLNCHFKCK